jgi:hypothetical protein
MPRKGPWRNAGAERRYRALHRLVPRRPVTHEAVTTTPVGSAPVQAPAEPVLDLRADHEGRGAHAAG